MWAKETFIPLKPIHARTGAELNQTGTTLLSSEGSHWEVPSRESKLPRKRLVLRNARPATGTQNAPTSYRDPEPRNPEFPRKKTEKFLPGGRAQTPSKKTKMTTKARNYNLSSIFRPFSIFEFFEGIWARPPREELFGFSRKFGVPGFWIPVAGRAFRKPCSALLNQCWLILGETPTRQGLFIAYSRPSLENSQKYFS